MLTDTQSQVVGQVLFFDQDARQCNFAAIFWSLTLHWVQKKQFKTHQLNVKLCKSLFSENNFHQCQIRIYEAIIHAVLLLMCLKE